MKIFSTAAACLFLATLAHAECVTIAPLVPTAFQLASRDVLITALLSGKAVNGVRIEVLTAANEPRFSLAIQERGVAALPPLLAGSYHVVAIAPAKPLGELFLAEVYFDVSRNLVDHPGLLTVNLVSANQFWPMKLPVVASEWRAVGNAVAIGPVQEFHGVVVDASGAAVPGATIRVTQEEHASESHPVEITADEGRRFSVFLAPGAYTALVEMQGFFTQKIVFEIAPHADAKDLKSLLNVGYC